MNITEVFNRTRDSGLIIAHSLKSIARSAGLPEDNEASKRMFEEMEEKRIG